MTAATATKFTVASVQALHQKAHAAGLAAGEAVTPVPMIVSGGYAPVLDGLCGFAWVNFPGNTAFGRAMKKAGIARPAYGGGLQVWVSAFGQSVARKECYASAYAAVLTEAGVERVTSNSRLD